MRFYTSFHYVQNDSKLGWCWYLGGVVLWHRHKTTPPKCESIQELVIPIPESSGEESHIINQTVLIHKIKGKWIKSATVQSGCVK
jgi:hypothetical protein